MELLIRLIGEFIGLVGSIALLPALLLLFLLVPTGLELLAGMMGAPSLLRPTRTTRSSSPWLRRVGKVCLGVAGFLATGLLLLNTFFFEPVLRWSLDRAREKTGVDVRFESATGSFLSGSVTLRKVTVQRTDAVRSNIDLTIGDAKADVSILSLMQSHVRLEGLRLVDVKGSYQRARVNLPRRDFTIDTLMIENAVVDLKEPDVDAPALPLKIDRLECRPLRRDTALFDLLFRSNGQGTIAGAPFEIQSHATPDGRTTTWRAKDVPVGFLGSYVGEPFDWLTTGTVDVDVVDSWSDGPSPEIDSHWKLDFRNVSAAVPDRITGFRRAVAEPVVRFVQAHPAHLPLEFRLRLEKGHFTGATSVETSGILKAAADGAVEELARRAKVPVETLKELGRRAFEDLKRFVARRSRKSGD